MYWIAVAGALIALILTTIGALRAYGEVKTLKRRLDGYRDLPLVGAIDRASAQVREMQAKEVEVRVLVARAEKALHAIAAGLAEIAGIWTTTRTAADSCSREVKALRAVFVAPHSNSH